MSQPKTPGQQHLAYIAHEGVTRCATSWKRNRIAWLLAFAAVIILANLLTSTYGLVTILGLTATAGTWVAGLGFVVRDGLHESGGWRWVAVAIGVGCLLSAALSPRLALASAVAFALSETCDWGVYAPLRRRGRPLAAVTSNVVGSIVDTLAFLLIAGFPLAGAWTQVLIKVAVTTLTVGVLNALSRYSRQRRRGSSDA